MSQEAPLKLVPDPAPEPPDPFIGQVLDGRYEIEKVLGKGGMGLVYAAKHVMLGKRLAIKVLKDDVSADEQVIARFRREAQAASAIGSPHICDVSDFGTMPDGSTYFVMEFLNGPSLAGAMEQQSPMSTERVVDIGKQLCDALGAAHERGIVHRDLKPDNVHLVQQGSRTDFVKVLDFGIAKVGDQAGKKLTQAGQVFGTPHYMSPEQCAGRDVDHRTDIYALGVMLYEMACGKVPFDADNLMGVLTKHVYEQPIPPRELPPPVEVPAGLEAVILRCLAKQASDRYQSMAELKADLVQVAQGGTPEAVVQSLGPRTVPKTQMISSDSVPHLAGVAPAEPSQLPAEHEEPGRSKLGLIAGAALLLLLLGGGAFAAALAFGGDDGASDAVAEEPADDGAGTGATGGATGEGTTAEGADAPGEGEGAEGGDLADGDADGADGAAPADPTPAEPEVVMVTLSSNPEGAEVYAADGSLMGNTPLEIARPTGDQPTQVTLRLADHEEREVAISRLTSANGLTVTLSRERRRARRRSRPAAAPVPTPRPQPMAPSPPPRPRPSSSEIISPW